MTIKENTERICRLEAKMNRLEFLLWYIAGALSIKFGSELLPHISAFVP